MLKYKKPMRLKMSKASKKELSSYTDDELDKLEHHTLDVAKIMEYANPFNGCWMELDKPITIEEVKQCIKDGKAELAITPSWYDIAFKKVQLTPEEIRENHVKKIAFFALNEPEKVISIDVGIPSMGHYPDYILDDGNHRLAGTIVSGRPTIKASVSGAEDHAREMGLWNPNEFHIEATRRFFARQTPRDPDDEVAIQMVKIPQVAAIPQCVKPPIPKIKM
jgi:hypothetical protein